MSTKERRHEGAGPESAGSTRRTGVRRVPSWLATAATSPPTTASPTSSDANVRARAWAAPSIGSPRASSTPAATPSAAPANSGTAPWPTTATQPRPQGTPCTRHQPTSPRIWAAAPRSATARVNQVNTSRIATPTVTPTVTLRCSAPIRSTSAARSVVTEKSTRRA